MRDREEREDFYQFLVDHIIMAKEKAGEVIMMGDFNGHVEGWTSGSTNGNGKLLRREVEATGMTLLPSKAVTFLGRNGRPTCVDYMATWGTEELELRTISDGMSGSDHVPIGVVIELRRPRLLREQ